MVAEGPAVAGAGPCRVDLGVSRGDTPDRSGTSRRRLQSSCSRRIGSSLYAACDFLPGDQPWAHRVLTSALQALGEPARRPDRGSDREPCVC